MAALPGQQTGSQILNKPVFSNMGNIINKTRHSHVLYLDQQMCEEADQ